MNQADLQFEACRGEPLFDASIEEFDLNLTTNGMKKELQAMKDFGVYDEVHNTSDNDHTLTGAVPTMWVKRPKRVVIACATCASTIKCDRVLITTPYMPL